MLVKKLNQKLGQMPKSWKNAGAGWLKLNQQKSVELSCLTFLEYPPLNKRPRGKR